MVSEESICRLTKFSNKCCIIHALDMINPSDPDFDFELLATLLSLKRVFHRISPSCQEFICLCMQQRFTDKELA
jgi:hypothetical protein